MRLIQIEIENFKGIGTRQAIELRPITLLFGANSAGKSTLLQALHYLREILERGNIDPDVTVAGGLTDLGGFETLVHNHQLDRTVTLKVTLDLSDEPGVEDLPLNAGESIEDREFLELPIGYLVGDNAAYRGEGLVREVGLAVDLRWGELEHTPYVSRFAIEMNGEAFAAITSPSDAGRALLTEFNFESPLLRRALPQDEDPDGGGIASSSPLEDEISALGREAAADRSTADTLDGQLRIAVGTEKGALPSLNRELVLDIRDPDAERVEDEENTRRVNGLRSLLSEMILGPARLVRDHLEQMTYIGPLREMPTRNYRPQVSPDRARWARGLAAWDLLYNDRTGEVIDELNRWLSGEHRLCTTYQFDRFEFRAIPVSSAMHHMLEGPLTAGRLRALQDRYLSLPVRTEIGMRDTDKDIVVQPCDVGIGISQMIPVVVGALQQHDGILVIEQPELHVHPAIQTGMGDLFIHAAAGDRDELYSGNTLIIETHSEHIILRLLRRIREASEDELPPDVAGLDSADLAVVYVESGKKGTRFTALRVDAEGEFRDRWPHGFFEERAGELF